MRHPGLEAAAGDIISLYNACLQNSSESLTIMNNLMDIIGWISHTSFPSHPCNGMRFQELNDHPKLYLDMEYLAANDAEPSSIKAGRGRVLPWRPVPGRFGEALILLSRVVRATVVDREGRAAGEITDLSLDKSTGRVNYAIVSFGRFLGLRSRLHPVPWTLLRYDARNEGYTIPLTMLELDEAPSLTPAELERLSAGDRLWRDRLASYYNPLSNMGTF